MVLLTAEKGLQQILTEVKLSMRVNYLALHRGDLERYLMVCEPNFLSLLGQTCVCNSTGSISIRPSNSIAVSGDPAR